MLPRKTLRQIPTSHSTLTLQPLTLFSTFNLEPSILFYYTHAQPKVKLNPEKIPYLHHGVSSFDRFGRSLKFLVNTLEEFHALGIDFVSVRQQIDTTTPAGKMTFGVISAMAEFERAMISERVREGMKRAKERGSRLGRPPLDRELVQKVLELRSQGMSYGQIAAEVERSRASVAGIVRRELSRKGKERDTLEPLENKPLEVRK